MMKLETVFESGNLFCLLPCLQSRLAFDHCCHVRDGGDLREYLLQCRARGDVHYILLIRDYGCDYVHDRARDHVRDRDDDESSYGLHVACRCS